MMASSSVALWSPDNQIVVPDNLSDPQQITARALQLRDRERTQLAANFSSGNYEMASTYVWTRTMALLKKQLGNLGPEFIGELIQRPDIDEYTEIATAISDSQAISLASDLGIFSPLQAKRLFHSQEIVTYFAGLGNEGGFGADEMMTPEEAVSCLRVCVQGVLGQQNIEAAQDFKEFRKKLTEETLTEDSREIDQLSASPYFFKRTAISILLSLFKNSKSAQFEHASRNAQLIIPKFWQGLKDPERWQIGQAYAEEYNDGRKAGVKALRSVLLEVSGFDYVPENLRSSTFIRVANEVIAAHEAMNNFYNEPAPMRELANLGTSIPGPAVADCITAVLCVRLGNRYGVSSAAQPAVDRVIDNISDDRWYFYLNGRLEFDRRVLYKLDETKPQKRWIALLKKLNIDPSQIKSKPVRDLIEASLDDDDQKIDRIARRLYHTAIGIKP